MDKQLYCFNCDTEAIAVLDETKAPICYTCLEAYECGQHHPEQTHTLIEEAEEPEK